MKWETIIRHYNVQHRPRSQKELDWFRRQPSLEAAINVAAKAENERGLRYSHQARITRQAIEEARRLLLQSHDEVQSCISFHELWLLIKNILAPVSGIGELYIYDTALRIGAYLGLLPERVYLHTGTRIGAKAFGFITHEREWINLNEFPVVLRYLSPHEIEDILCLYKPEKVLRKRGC